MNEYNPTNDDFTSGGKVPHEIICIKELNSQSKVLFLFILYRKQIVQTAATICLNESIISALHRVISSFDSQDKSKHDMVLGIYQKIK